MKKPSSLLVFGKRVKIKYQKNLIEDSEANGEYDKEKHIIVLDSSLKGEMFLLTLLHEGIHAVCERTGIRQAIDDGVEEIICENISMFLNENFNIKTK